MAALKKLLVYCYWIHAQFKTACYPDAILVTLAQYEYLEKSNHPVWDALRNNSSLLSEEKGEVSLSCLAQSVHNNTNQTQHESLHSAYVTVGANRCKFREGCENIGLDTSHQTHCSSGGTAHRATVAVLKSHFRGVFKKLIRDEAMMVFVEDDNTVSSTSVDHKAKLTAVKSIPLLFARGWEIPVDKHVVSIRRRMENSFVLAETRTYLDGQTDLYEI